METGKKVRFKLFLFLINFFLKGTHFFYIKRKLLNYTGITIGENTKIVGPLYLGTEVQLEIGEGCWINKNFSIEGNGRVQIGNNCDIAPDVSILTGSHEIGSSNKRAGKGVTWNYKIGDGTWIGARVILLNGIEIGNGVVIGAASLVNKRCEDNFLYAGIPIQPVKKLV